MWGWKERWRQVKVTACVLHPSIHSSPPVLCSILWHTTVSCFPISPSASIALLSAFHLPFLLTHSFLHQSHSPPSQYSPYAPVSGMLWDYSSQLKKQWEWRADTSVGHFLAHQWTRLARVQLTVQCHFHSSRRFWPWKWMKVLLNVFSEIFQSRLPFSGQFPNNWSLSKSEEVAHQKELASSLRGTHSAYHLPLSLKGNTQGAPKAFPPNV